MKTFKAALVILVAISTLNVSSALAAQPHMRLALDHLRAARAELKMAEHNKAGWRVRAIANVNRAIADTENGIAAGR